MFWYTREGCLPVQEIANLIGTKSEEQFVSLLLDDIGLDQGLVDQVKIAFQSTILRSQFISKILSGAHLYKNCGTSSPTTSEEEEDSYWSKVVAALLRERSDGQGSHFVEVVRPGGHYQEGPVVEDMMGTTG